MRSFKDARIASSFALTRSRFARACASSFKAVPSRLCASRRFATGVVIAVALTISLPSSAIAQARGAAPGAEPAQAGRGAGAGGGGAQGGGRGGRGGAPYTPTAGAKDLKA